MRSKPLDFQLTKSPSHDLGNKIQKTFMNKEIALCAFNGLEGAFVNTWFELISNATANISIKPVVVKWIEWVCKSLAHSLLSALKGPLLADKIFNALSSFNFAAQDY